MIVYLANKTQLREEILSNRIEAIAHRSPQEIMDEIAALDVESAEVLGKIKQLLNTEKTHV